MYIHKYKADSEGGMFYAGDGVVMSTALGWIQLAFYLLTGMFDRVGLRTKFCKTVGVVCRPCRVARVQEDESYTRRMTVEGGGLRSDISSRYYARSAGRICIRGHW